VAQQVLEYLGVPHDIDVRATRASGKRDAPVTEDDAYDHGNDIAALYAAANELPGDDPLRGGDMKNRRAGAGQAAIADSTSAEPAKPAANSDPDAKSISGVAQTAANVTQPTPRQASTPERQTAAVMVVDTKTLRVPSLIGLPVRKVIELAGAAGLEVQVSGNGTVREQAPAPGTMVAPGTQIVVRCGRP